MVGTSFTAHVAAPEDVCWWLRDELRAYDPSWVVQVEITVGGLVAGAARDGHGGRVRVWVSEGPLRADVEVEHTAPGPMDGHVAWAVVS